MSWQATAWAAKQRTGSPSRKCLLLAIANYADASGSCFPSQQTLATDTEQSVDTIQRNSRRLEKDGLLRLELVQRDGGRWPMMAYRLEMPKADTEPQNAVRQESNIWRAGPHHKRSPGRTTNGHRAAPRTPPGRTALRHEQREQKIEQAADVAEANCKMTKLALHVADRVAYIAGVDPQFMPPAWCGSALKVEAWLRNGWTEEAIVAGAKRAMARRPDNPPRSIAYFEQAIADVMAELAKPLPEGAAPQRQTANGPSGNTDVLAYMQNQRTAAAAKS